MGVNKLFPLTTLSYTWINWAKLMLSSEANKKIWTMSEQMIKIKRNCQDLMEAGNNTFPTTDNLVGQNISIKVRTVQCGEVETFILGKSWEKQCRKNLFDALPHSFYDCIFCSVFSLRRIHSYKKVIEKHRCLHDDRYN